MKTPATKLDQLPPHNPEAEQGIIGCLLHAPSEALDALDERGVEGEWFYDLRYQLVYHTARAMHFQTPPVLVDFITLFTELQRLGHLEQIGGVTFLNECQDAVAGVAHLPAYVVLVREQWQLRSAIAALTIAREDMASGTEEVGDAIEKAQSQLNKLSELHTHRTEQKIRQIMVDRVIPKLEAHYTRGRAQMSGLVTTGLEYLDKIFCGLGGDNGNYHVFAARPNVGKTSLITGIALHAALDFEFVDEVTEAAAQAAGELGFTTKEGKFMIKRKGVPVGISSLEMSAESLGQKMLFQRARADLQNWRTGYAKESDFPPMLLANTEICRFNNIIIDDTARENIGSIKAKWRRWYRQYGVRFFMLDYIQLIKSTDKKFRSDRVQEMEEISAELQALGKELNCPMAILAQLNRDYEKEPNRLPRLSDLKNCGAIEQDADSVTLLYKPSPYRPFSKEHTDEYEFFMECMGQAFGPDWKKWSGRPERINALVEKNKHGPKGDAELIFLKSSTLFLDWNQWLKEKGFKRAAKGEESRYKQSKIDPEDVP